MARVTADEAAEKWGRRLKSSTTDIKRGIERVTVAPGIRAVQQKEVLRSNFNKSLDDGTWENQTKSVTLDDWKAQAGGKGVDRISSGVDGAMKSQPAMYQRLLQAVDASVAEANKTPRGDLSANIQRMVTFAQSMASRKLRRTGGTR